MVINEVSMTGKITQISLGEMSLFVSGNTIATLIESLYEITWPADEISASEH